MILTACTDPADDRLVKQRELQIQLLPLVLCALGSTVFSNTQPSDISLLRESNALMIQKLFDMQTEIELLQASLDQNGAVNEVQSPAQAKASGDFMDKLKATGEIRHRFENRDFGSTLGVTPADESFFSQRARITLSGELRENLKFDMQLMDLRQWGSNRSVLRNNNDDFTGVQLLHVTHTDWIDNADVILGRQKLSFGDSLVLSHGNWVSRPATFDGVRVHKRRGRDQESVDFFYTKVNAGPIANRANGDDVDLGGIYAHFQPGENIGWASYGLIRRDGVLDETRYQLGVEGTFKRHKMDYELHLAMQEGAIGARDIGANLKKISARYTTKSAKQHRVYSHYYQASGDTNPLDNKSESWDPMYGTRHGRFGIADHFRLSNLTSFQVGMDYKPQRDTKVEISVTDIGLDSPNDRIMNSYGINTVNPGSGLTDVGWEFGVSWHQQHQKDHAWFAGFSRFDGAEASKRFLQGLDGANFLYAGSELSF